MWYVDDTRFAKSERLQFNGNNKIEILEWAHSKGFTQVHEVLGSVRVTYGNEEIILQETEWIAIDPEGYPVVLVRSEKDYML